MFACMLQTRVCMCPVVMLYLYMYCWHVWEQMKKCLMKGGNYLFQLKCKVTPEDILDMVIQLVSMIHTVSLFGVILYWCWFTWRLYTHVAILISHGCYWELSEILLQEDVIVYIQVSLGPGLLYGSSERVGKAAQSVQKFAYLINFCDSQLCFPLANLVQIPSGLVHIYWVHSVK